jgi:hypothetical protein
MDIVDYALTAASLGLRVLPLDPFSANPAIANWREVATTNATTISAWFAARPVNYGIVTGASSDLFVVELTGKAARDWWRSRGFSSGMKVTVPSGVDQTQLYFRVDGMNVTSGAPRVGVQIHGEDDFVPGPGSILQTGTFKGDFYQLSTSDFDPSVDLGEGGWGAMLPLLEIAGLLPDFTTDGQDFVKRIIAKPTTEREGRSFRVRLIREALAAGLNPQQALSIAWASAAGLDLHDSSFGESIIREELEAAIGSQLVPTDIDRRSRPQRLPLLTEEERERVSVTSWWGVRYVEWATRVHPGSSSLLHEHYRWVTLSRIFTGQGVVPKTRGALSLDMGEVVLSGNASAVELAKEAMGSLLQAVGIETQPPIDISDATKRLVKAGTSFEGTPAAGGSALSRLGADTFAQYVWTVDAFSADDLPSEEQRQQRLIPTPWRLVTDIADACEKLRLVVGGAPVAVYMVPDALERHASFTNALSEMWAKGSALETAWRGLADTVWKCAILVALVDGKHEVSLEHELIAIEQAETWLGNAMWVNEQAESA